MIINLLTILCLIIASAWTTITWYFIKFTIEDLKKEYDKYEDLGMKILLIIFTGSISIVFWIGYYLLYTV